MASIHPTKAGFTIHWRYGAEQFNQSADVSKDDPQARQKAEAIKGRIEDTLRALKSGWLTLPADADYETVKRFIFTGGKKTEKDTVAVPQEILTLQGLFDRYRASDPTNEASTLYTEGVHQRHLIRLLGGDRDVEGIDFPAIQEYASNRKRGYTHSGRHFKKVGPDTIEKDLKTFSKVWSWGVDRGLISRSRPWQFGKLDMGKADEAEPFRDFDEITEIINEGSLNGEQQARLWACLYLRGHEVDELLEHVRTHASAGFAYPMFALCALTGCRRSEAINSLKRDFNWTKGIVTIRGKKTNIKGQGVSLRHVPMNSLLVEAMKEWFQKHPGGQYAICDESGNPITIASGRLDRVFEASLKGSKFEVMRGWHCLRHSFASNLASKGVDQRVINKFMGHMDDKTVKRYQHLSRETGVDAVNSLLSR